MVSQQVVHRCCSLLRLASSAILSAVMAMKLAANDLGE
jgi:hypothetical protein